MRFINITAAWILCAALRASGCDQEPCATGCRAAEEVGRRQDPNFTYQTGDIVLPNKVATLHLGDSYRYLDPAETEKLLVAWGNAAGQ